MYVTDMLLSLYSHGSSASLSDCRFLGFDPMFCRAICLVSVLVSSAALTSTQQSRDGI